MNERIRELAVEAGLPTALDYHQRRYEKFAELIVQECVHAVQNRGGMCGALASNWIKEHFGVEE